MPVPERPQPRPAGHEPRTLVSRSPVSRARQGQCQPAPGELHRRPRKIVFADELRPRAPPHAEKPPKVLGPRPNPVPDYELKYPPVSSRRDRSRYAAVFQDQYGEFLELQREVGATQAKLRQLEALLMSLPPPRSQEEAHVAARVWREFEKKRAEAQLLSLWSLLDTGQALRFSPSTTEEKGLLCSLLTSNWRSSCLSLVTTRMISLHHYARFSQSEAEDLKQWPLSESHKKVTNVKASNS